MKRGAQNPFPGVGLSGGMATTRTPAELLKDSRAAREQGKQWLTAGLGIGAVGVLGAVAGAVCPLCVVATPTLLGAGLIRTAWARHLDQRARASAATETATGTAEPVPVDR